MASHADDVFLMEQSMCYEQPAWKNCALICAGIDQSPAPDKRELVIIYSKFIVSAFRETFPHHLRQILYYGHTELLRVHCQILQTLLFCNPLTQIEDTGVTVQPSVQFKGAVLGTERSPVSAERQDSKHCVFLD